MKTKSKKNTSTSKEGKQKEKKNKEKERNIIIHLHLNWIPILNQSLALSIFILHTQTLIQFSRCDTKFVFVSPLFVEMYISGFVYNSIPMKMVKILKCSQCRESYITHTHKISFLLTSFQFPKTLFSSLNKLFEFFIQLNVLSHFELMSIIFPATHFCFSHFVPIDLNGYYRTDKTQ